jgi:hypothetical protein
MCAKIRKKFLYYSYLLNLQKIFEMKSAMFHTQRCDTVLQIDWQKISFNTRECFRVTDFWGVLYINDTVLSGGSEPGVCKVYFLRYRNISKRTEEVLTTLVYTHISFSVHGINKICFKRRSPCHFYSTRTHVLR